VDFRQAVLGEIATRSGQHITSIDVGLLVRRLILFDRVIVKSYRLHEVPLLAKVFGKSGIQELLNSGILKLSSEFTTIITDIHRNGQRFAPPEHFTFGIVDAANREADLSKELSRLQRVPGLKNRERTQIEELVWKSMVRPPPTFGAEMLKQVDADLRANSPLLQAAILEQLRTLPNRGNLTPDEVEITVEEPSTRMFHVKTSISSQFGLTAEDTHSLLQRSVTGVVNLDHRLAEMSAYTAMTGFLENEAPLLFGKLVGLFAPQNPKLAERQFERVIEIAELPDFKSGQRVDVQRLMKIRDSPECRDFRDWLPNAEDMSEAEIRKMTKGVRNKLADLAGSPGGKFIRLAATTAIGLAGLPFGVAAGAVDSFLVDRVLPQSGVVAFLNELYPSLFIAA
jgi:hypothetical protein